MNAIHRKAGTDGKRENGYTVGVNENEEAARDARRILKLLQTHHRHHRESERLLRELAARVSRQVEALLAERTDRPVAADGEGDRPGESAGADEAWPALAAAATLARELPAQLRDAIIAKLPPELEEQFLGALYSFDALPSLDARALQAIVRRTNKRTLAIALLGAPEAHFHAITGNMSRRAAQMLREDMESLLAAGELSTRDVQLARTALSSVIRDEAGSGT